MRWLLVLLATSAFADDRVELKTLHKFPGVDLVESVNDAVYGHGGPPAKISYAFITFDVRDQRAHRIEVRSIAVVVSNCGKKNAKVKPRKLLGHTLHAWDDIDPIAKGKTSVATPVGKPDRYGVKLDFEGLETYDACGLAIDLVVDRVRKKIELPFTITRLEPRPE